MKTTQIIIIAGIALLTSTLAFAEPKEFGPADADGDGVVSKEEFSKAGFEDMSFDEADLNEDGKIDKAEYEEALAGCA
jgi:hypothetical protein